MNRTFLPSLAISISALLLLRASNSSACETGSATITTLSSIPGAGYQVFWMNPSGELTGFFFVAGDHPSHAFLFGRGTLTDLGTLGGTTSEGHWINSSGQVVGKSALPGDSQSHAFLQSNGSMIDLGTLGGPSSTAAAINDSGTVIGSSDLSGGTAGFIYANGTLTGLGNLGSNYSSALALNNNGMVVGESGVPSGAVHGFTYANGALTDVGTLGGTYSSSFAVNDAGEVVGEAKVLSADIHGFVYLAGSMTDVGTLGGTYSSAYLINSNGQASGLANTTDDLETHGFLYSNGTLTDLGTLGGSYSFPNGLNDKGQVVGESAIGAGAPHAFLWDKGTMTDLNTLLPANSGWELSTALYINEVGRVVGVGSYAGLSQWFIFDLASGNLSPMAVAGSDQIVDCQVQVALDGSHSTDPDNGSLAFEWSSGDNTLGTNPIMSVSLPLGTNVVTLKVTDPCGASAQTNVTIIVADTTPPAGSCPAAVTVSADLNCLATVPNLTSQVVASDNCTPAQSIVISQSPAPGTFLGLGSHVISLTVTDSSGNSSSCAVAFSVVDTTPPAIVSAPAPFTLSAGSCGRAQLPNLLPNFLVADSCTPANSLGKSQNPPAGTLVGVGHHFVTLTATDAAGNSSSVSIPLAIIDQAAPVIQSIVANPSVLSPPNHQLVPVTISTVVTDNCDPAPLTKIISITANEPISRDDIRITGNLSARLAASKCSSGSARIYTVTVQSTDASGNSSTAQVTVTVAKTGGSGSGVLTRLRGFGHLQNVSHCKSNQVF